MENPEGRDAALVLCAATARRDSDPARNLGQCAGTAPGKRPGRDVASDADGCRSGGKIAMRAAHITHQTPNFLTGFGGSRICE